MLHFSIRGLPPLTNICVQSALLLGLSFQRFSRKTYAYGMRLSEVHNSHQMLVFSTEESNEFIFMLTKNLLLMATKGNCVHS